MAEEIDRQMRDGRPDVARNLIGALVDQEQRVLNLLRALQLQVAKRR
jgi:hypothetical protein